MSIWTEDESGGGASGSNTPDAPSALPTTKRYELEVPSTALGLAPLWSEASVPPSVTTIYDTDARTIAAGGGWRDVPHVQITDFTPTETSAKLRIWGILALGASGINVRVLAKMQYRIGTGNWTDLRMIGSVPTQYDYEDYFVKPMPFDFEWSPNTTSAIDLRFQVVTYTSGNASSNAVYVNRPGSGSGPQSPDYTSCIRVQEV